jgi:hypothetical protein
MWTSRKTFERSSVDSNAEGERGTWTFVLTDSGLVTYTKACQILSAKGNSYPLCQKRRREARGKEEINVQRICKICERSATRYHPLCPHHRGRLSLPRLQVSVRQVGAGTIQCKPVHAVRVP